METLQRNAVISILGVMALGGVIAAALHFFDPKTHPISLVLPPLSAIVSLSLLLYLIKYPQQIYRVIRMCLGWISFILLFPEYFFVIEATFNPDKKLIDTLPPISAGIFLLTTGMIVFLRPRRLVRLALALWFFTAAPVVSYLIFHPQELQTPRGLDLMISLLPAMGINLFLILFYTRLQDALDKLHIEQLHLKEVSEQDALTGVFNRGAGERILQRLIDQTDQKLGIILCDIDHFKQVNDNHGHLTGDLVLQAIAKCCQTHLRPKDTLIRWGGEEFLIVAPGNNETELAHLAERLRRAISDQQIADVGKITASFGVACWQPEENLTQLFSRADQALYQAKGWGRNQVVLA